MVTGTARGSNPRQPKIFGRENINYQGPDKASDVPLDTDLLYGNSDFTPAQDPGLPSSSDPLDVVLVAQQVEYEGIDSAAEVLLNTIDHSGGTTWISTPTGRVIPVIGVEIQTTSRKGEDTDHLLFQVDPEAQMPDGRSFADHISDDMQRRYDADAVGKQVTVVPPEELRSDYAKYFLSVDGLSGAGVKHTGEIGGLYALENIPDDQGHLHSAPRGTGLALLQQGMEEGGTYLECFDTFLTGYYKKAGMVPVAQLEFNRDYAPVGWDYDAMKQYHDGEPPIMFMVRSDIYDGDKIVPFEEWDDADDHVHTLIRS